MNRKNQFLLCTIIILFCECKIVAQNRLFYKNSKEVEGYHQKNIKTLDKLIEKDTANCKLIIARGLKYYFLNNHTKALKDIDKTLELCPNDKENYELYRMKAALNDRLGDLDQAYAYYNKSIELNPNYAAALVDRGMFLSSRMNMCYIGEKDIDKALKLKPKWADAHCAKGINLECNLYPEEAIKHYLKAIEYKTKKDNFLHKAYNNLGALYNKKQMYNEAIKLFDEALKIHPNYDYALTNRAEAKFRTGDEKSACKDIETAISFGRTGLKAGYKTHCSK